MCDFGTVLLGSFSRAANLSTIDHSSEKGGATVLPSAEKLKWKNGEPWMDICALAAVEMDSVKLMALVAEVDRLLEEKERTGKGAGRSLLSGFKRWGTMAIRADGQDILHQSGCLRREQVSDRVTFGHYSSYPRSRSDPFHTRTYMHGVQNYGSARKRFVRLRRGVDDSHHLVRGEEPLFGFDLSRQREAVERVMEYVALLAGRFPD